MKTELKPKGKKIKREERGITLIALVITIIVLLILAGISVTMLTGENSILKQAVNVREQTIIGQEKENIELAYITAAMKKLGDNVTANDLQDELDAMLGDTGETDATKKKTTVKQNPKNILSVLFRETQHNYNVNNGQVTKTLEDGIYVGNVRLGGLYLPDVNNMSYEDYQSSISDEEKIIGTFFGKCYDKTATNSEYKDALESAEKVGISREWIDYAYNNQGDIIRNIQVSSYNINPTSPDRTSWDTVITFTADIISVDKNLDFDLNTYIQYTVVLEKDTETGALRGAYENGPTNPEAISFCYKDENEEIPDEVQLPFGMVLKHVEDPHTADDFINQGYSQEEATQMANDWNNGVWGDCVIEWQGQSFTCPELRAYILNNTKIVYNGQTVNITSSTSGEELDDLFGIKAEDLYNKGYIDELANQ